MPVLSGDAFAARFRSLSAGERIAFLADLWRARGASVSEAADGLTVHEDGVPRRVRIVGRFPLRVAPADILVGTADSHRARALADRHEATFVSPDELRTWLLYGLDRRTADRLARIHFGEPLSALETGAGFTNPVSISGAVAVGLLGIMIVAALGGVGPLDVDGGSAEDPSTMAPSSVDDAPTAAGTASNATESGGALRYPAGLSEVGVEDASTLVAAHRSQLAGHPHRLWMRYEGPAADSLYPNATRYRYSRMMTADGYSMIGAWTRSNTTANESASLTQGEYRTSDRHVNWRDDGARLTVYENATYVEHLFDPRGPHHAIDHYEAALAAASVSLDTRHRGGERQHVLIMTGPPPGDHFRNAADFGGIAVLTERGRLVELSVSYTHRPTGEPVTVRVTISAVDSVTGVSLPTGVLEAIEEGDAARP